MKFFYPLVAILLITISACKQNFDITANYKEIPVVYALLNAQEHTHYVRIQKGYLIDGNALVAAGIADSVYYKDSLKVQLRTLPNGTVYNLTKINGDLLGLPKDSGTFANSPNILYSFTGSLDASKEYRLEITNTSNGKLIYAQTTLVKDFQINTPIKGAKLNLISNGTSHIRWADAENAGIYDLVIRFHYSEFKLSDGTFYKNDSVDIPFFKSLIHDYTAGYTNDIDFSEELVLKYLAAHIHADIEVTREFNVLKGMQFKFSCGGDSLQKFVQSAQAQGGLASNEALPPYTNVHDGAGLFSSRYFKEVDSVLLSNPGLDSLACSDYSRALHFKNHNGVVCP